MSLDNRYLYTYILLSLFYNVVIVSKLENNALFC